MFVISPSKNNEEKASTVHRHEACPKPWRPLNHEYAESSMQALEKALFQGPGYDFPNIR